MICIAERQHSSAWHAGFLAMLPRIQKNARFAFRNLPPEEREEAVAEVLANAWRAYARLAELGRLNLAYPTVLARYGIVRVYDGRRVGNRLSGDEVLSAHAQSCHSWIGADRHRAFAAPSFLQPDPAGIGCRESGLF